MALKAPVDCLRPVSMTERMSAGLLVIRGQAGLGAVAIGDPHLRPDAAEELLDRLLGAAGMGQKAGIFAVVENPQPPASLADPQAGFVGTDHGSRQQPRADGGAGGGEAPARLEENVDERARMSILLPESNPPNAIEMR